MSIHFRIKARCTVFCCTNALVGEKIAIVSSKPQTTRNRITAIVSRGEMQFVLMDTPGFHKPRTKLGDYMVNIVRESVAELHGGSYTIIPDQIEAGTYMVAAAATGGEILIKNIIPKHMEGISAKLRETGTVIEEYEEALLVKGPTSLRRINLKTMPYPGFPTDMQPQFGVLLCLANGTSVITEGIYDNRFKYVNELRKMGAEIQVDGRVAVIDGGRRLTGAPVHACDLRAGAAMVIAGMVASGVTEIDDIHFIERGYERFVEKLNALGADIRVHYDEEDALSARAFSAS